MKSALVILVVGGLGTFGVSSRSWAEQQSTCVHQEFQYQNGVNFKGHKVASFDNAGLKLLEQARGLEKQAQGEKAKGNLAKSKPLLEKSKSLEAEAQKHYHVVFWDRAEDQDRGSNPSLLSGCPKKVREGGEAVLNPKSNLRNTCTRKGLDLPSREELEAIKNCFLPGKDTVVAQKFSGLKELQTILKPKGDLYIASKSISTSVSSQMTEHVFALSPKYGSLSEAMETSEVFAIHCVANLKSAPQGH
jgi:hypothetical protein